MIMAPILLSRVDARRNMARHYSLAQLGQSNRTKQVRVQTSH